VPNDNEQITLADYTSAVGRHSRHITREAGVKRRSVNKQEPRGMYKYTVWLVVLPREGIMITKSCDYVNPFKSSNFAKRRYPIKR
jgi:hypothetical protein